MSSTPSVKYGLACAGLAFSPEHALLCCTEARSAGAVDGAGVHG
jgi:hypothetical protein